MSVFSGYRAPGQDITLVQFFRTSLATDTCVVSIKRASDGKYYDFSRSDTDLDDRFQTTPVTGTAAATWLGDGDWKYTLATTSTLSSGIYSFVFTLTRTGDVNFSTSAQQYVEVTTQSQTVTPWTGTSLSTLANVKAWLEIPEVTTTWDTLIGDIILPAVTKRIQNYCKQTFIAAEYTEYHDIVVPRNWIYLDERPVTAVSALYQDYAIPKVYGSDTLVNASYYEWYADGRLELIPGWTFGTGNYYKGNKIVKVLYSAGYTTIPSDLQEACIIQTVYDFQRRRKEHLQSEVVGASKAQTMQYVTPSGLLEEVEHRLVPYMKATSFGAE